MRRLLCCTCLTPIAVLGLVVPAQAETVIDDEVTTPLLTSELADGAGDDLLIDGDGAVTLTGGVAVTLDSDNDVTNEGDITVSDADGGAGILAEAGRTGDIINSGTILIDEDYEAEDDDDDGDADGPFAEGSDRYAIRIAEGGTFTGTVDNSGTIDVFGNDSAGIAIDSALDGSLLSSGSIDLVGDDGQGIRAGDVSGDVSVTGAVIARGENSVAVDLSGDIGGQLVIQNTVAASGYRSLTAPSDTEDLDEDDLLQGGPAIRIAGNVAGGILLDVAPDDEDEDEDDEDGDGVDDSAESDADVTSFGEAAAIEIGAAEDIVIGAPAGDEPSYGLDLNGRVRGLGVYDGATATAIEIGGAGGAVEIAGGIRNAGTISAVSTDSNAQAVMLSAGAASPTFVNSGIVRASGGAEEDSRAVALLIEEGAVLESVVNSGELEAVTDEDGTAYAIYDRSGSLDLIVNSGELEARGGEDGRNVAIDLSANQTGAVVRQTETEDGGVAAELNGDVRFGTGGDLFEVLGGTVTGDASFGDGANRLVLGNDAGFTGNAVFGADDDEVSISGSARFIGDIDFGTGAGTLVIGEDALLRGGLAHSGTLDVTVNGGTLDAANVGTITLSSLSLNEGSTLGVTVNPETAEQSLFDVGGTASFAEGSALSVRLTGAAASEGEFLVLTADTLVGADNLAQNTASLPFLFDGSVSVDETAGEVSVTLARKSAEALGLTTSQSRAYDAVFEALDNDEDVAGVFLNLADGNGVRGSLQQMLPDHAGGTFEAVSLASRQIARVLEDPSAHYVDLGGWGYWLQQAAWGTSSDSDDTASYDIGGWGAGGGFEFGDTGFGGVGLSFSYLSSDIEDDGTGNEVIADQFEGAVHWRGDWNGVQAHLRGSAAYVSYDSERGFTGDLDGETISRTADGEWDGWLYSASGGLSYDFRAGRFSLRPAATLDYYRLDESGYSEAGGGDAFNLTVEDRSSDELAATGRLVAGLMFGGDRPGGGWMRVEAEGGRRQILSGSLGDTVASFEGGDEFTLAAEERTDGWVGGLRLVGGDDLFTLGGEINAEEQQGRYAIAGRVSLRVGF
ncbi:autotransporter domain-containing protein [Pacificimonas flava]|uniref:Autotransporter domain-containing protein n=2 Tax=Pacificimonas TaxID=1960290 RepID=A0A219B2W5_9SPHN|nr:MULTISPECIES: autotransporter outer membrane beta-barrel domain-containing protein [Pacificimonas]MBZ6377851.1 autotransporter domain-containing protein [Pacificimonas aurantium]OWV32486.1 autotransporter domain-containing protein [Pacificimonas flava]